MRGSAAPRSSASRALGWLRRAAWAALAAFALLTWQGGAGGAYAYEGTDLGGVPAPDFALTNQEGERVTLADYRGRAVLLTFLDGHCKDVCPETLRTMAELEARLGRDAARVAFVAVSVDPWLDAVGRPAFIASQPGNVAPRAWDFLTGTEAELKPVWDAYHVAVVEELVGRYGVNGEHDTGFFLIDPAGRERLYIQSDADPGTILRQIRRVAELGG